ncbi:MAG TPA: FAD-binding oxidoreductase [Dehalococcoidia bacterium]|nr:FAD-binding oxidoreductase [Dehalococcoidia bacterium]
MVAGEALAESTLQALRADFRGTLIEPGTAGYDEARSVWNGNIDKRPALIARCSGVADVVAAVNFARDNGLVVAVRGGGHNAAGYGTCDDGIVIDLSPMKGVRVDPAARTAFVQGGATWADFDRETQVFGLATTGGTVSNTGVGGLTLGGGIGWLQGEHGLSCDNLLSADVVTADGRCLRASATENPDLFWGLRGGGGNFGAVTAFEFKLHPVGPLVLGGMVVHPQSEAKAVLRFYREFAQRLPDAGGISGAALLTLPDGTPAVAMLLVYNGPLDEGERVLAPARQFGSPIADLIQPMPYCVRQTLLDEAFAAHGIQRYWKSGDAAELSDAIIDLLVEGAAGCPSPLSSIALFRLQGAFARVAPDATAFALREPLWDLNVVSQWIDPGDSEQNIGWARGLWAQVEPLTGGGRVYVNHFAADDKPERNRASYGPNYERLAALKRRYDPENLFRLNPNIRPAG